MRVLTFDRRFVPSILDGTKQQTIRPNGRRPHVIDVGTPLSLRIWLGVAYRSNQFQIAKVVVTSVASIIVDEGLIWIDRQPVPDLEKFARQDGFSDLESFLAYFREYARLPFAGRLICWDKLEEVQTPHD